MLVFIDQVLYGYCQTLCLSLCFLLSDHMFFGLCKADQQRLLEHLLKLLRILAFCVSWRLFSNNLSYIFLPLGHKLPLLILNITIMLIRFYHSCDYWDLIQSPRLYHFLHPYFSLFGCLIHDLVRFVISESFILGSKITHLS